MSSMTFTDPNVRHYSRLIMRLALDLERIRTGSGPTAEDLEHAPLIEGWSVGARAEPALVGTIFDHPTTNGPAVTSGVYVLDPQQRYARTLSRWYRLGKELS